MLRAVIRVEWLSTLRERSVWIVLGAFVPLVAYAAFNAGAFVRTEAAAIATAEREDAGRIAKLRRRARAIESGAEPRSATDPRDPLLVGRDLAPRAASWPLGPLAVVSIGQRDVLPSTVLLTVRARVGDGASDEPSSPTARAAGAFDLAFVFVVLLPLVVIALSFDLVSGERERGTLALVLSQPVSLGTFVLGKTLQRALLVVAVVLALGLVAPIAAGARPFEGDGPLRLALYGALLVGYVAFWFSAALAVNAFGRSSAGNALVLVGTWLALVVVVPGLATVGLDALHPPPSRIALVNLAREATRTAEARAAAIEGDHGAADRPGVDRTSREFVEVQRRLGRDVAPVLRSFRDQLDAQQRWVDVLRFVSPAIVMSEGLNEIAGSSVRGHQRFAAQLDGHHRALQRFFFDRIRRGATLRSTDYDAMPRFAYVEAPTRDLLVRVLSSLAGLLSLGGVLLAIAWRRLGATEIDVR
ncbi:MAG: ABC transporter permease subunit [Deltaproteobacteria bacterium]|nr:ABC transporter permease subunit [Deltaproteobacteria bacterium]